MAASISGHQRSGVAKAIWREIISVSEQSIIMATAAQRKREKRRNLAKENGELSDGGEMSA